MTRVLVVGGGITGVAAAQRLRELTGPRVGITVVDGAGRLGGKIRTGDVDGTPVEQGAESVLVRRPEAVRLAETVGLGDTLVHPAAVPAALAIDGELKPLPSGTLMGIPTDPADASLAAVLTAAGRERLAAEPDRGESLSPEGGDISVGGLVADRLGPEVVDRLVEPLLGGVYAGRADRLSLAMTVPALAAALPRHTSLIEAARSCLRPVTGAPVFGSVTGGLSRLVAATLAAADADTVLGRPVRELHRTPTGWRAIIGATRDPEELIADAVVLAVPGYPAARVLADPVPSAAAEMADLEYASVGLVTLTLRNVALPRLSGFLVPVSAGYAVKAATFFTRKWPHLADQMPADTAIVRVSVGRYGDEAVLHRDDEDLVRLAGKELSALLGVDLPAPTSARVDRWGGALPQYAPGHADRVRRARSAVAKHPGLALAGAAYDGVGIAACIASGRAAAEQIAAELRGRPGADVNPTARPEEGTPS